MQVYNPWAAHKSAYTCPHAREVRQHSSRDDIVNSPRPKERFHLAYHTHYYGPSTVEVLHFLLTHGTAFGPLTGAVIHDLCGCQTAPLKKIDDTSGPIEMEYH